MGETPPLPNMKLVLLFALLGLAAAAPLLKVQDYESMFSRWMTDYSVEYSCTEELFERFHVWSSNMEFIIRHQANENRTHELAMNEFGDLTNEEFANKYHGYIPRTGQNEIAELDTTDIPTSVDWTQKGVVTPVKNQGQCGSCWAFSTTGSVESAHAIKTGKLISLSEQELVDCSHNGNQGCNGGLMDYAFQWIIQNGGLCSEADYPYHASDGTCKKSDCKSQFTISGYKDVPPNDQKSLTAAVAQQPVSVAVDAGGSNWQFYNGGVMSGACGTALDHGVLAVGYGTENGKQFYKVKNSWGANWGESGYIKLLRDTSSTGECGIAMDPSYPIA